MFLKFLKLEIKSFLRGSTVGMGIAMKILRFVGILYFFFMFILGGIGAFYLIEEELGEDALKLVSKYLIVVWALDLVLKYFFQELSTQNIKPFLTLNIPKKSIVNYTLFKTFISPFSWINSAFFITFIITCILNETPFMNGVGWFLGVSALLYLNNFINILFNNNEKVAIVFAVIVATFGALFYFDIFSILDYSEKLFYAFYSQPLLAIIPILIFIGLWRICFKNILKEFYLDQGLEAKKVYGKTENIAFLNKYGSLGTFINNDIKLLKRNKATKNILFGSFAFLFYGLLIYTSDLYTTSAMKMFMGLFVMGGFQFLFGQRVPSFDSSYYPLMMTMNIPYREYLMSKWWLMNIVTLITMVLALFYAFISWDLYFTFFAAGLYNIGVNSQITLWAGAYNKMPLDLNAKEKRMAQKNSFNMKGLLLTIPKLLLPMLVFALVKYFFGITSAVISIAIIGFIGFLLRDKIFDIVIKEYKKEKYDTLAAFKK